MPAKPDLKNSLPSSDPYEHIGTICTLGPEKTNCHAAAEQWFAVRRPTLATPNVRLFASLEEAIPFVSENEGAALMACAAYPSLHNIVFENIDWLDMVDSLLVPTHPMVLARRSGVELRTASTHPAPRALVPEGVEARLVLSNSQAALDCAAGLSDGCIATLPAVRAQDLQILKDFGPVGMAFTIHAHRFFRKEI